MRTRPLLDVLLKKPNDVVGCVRFGPFERGARAFHGRMHAPAKLATAIAAGVSLPACHRLLSLVTPVHKINSDEDCTDSIFEHF
jgi:hypothetical protein